MQDAFCIAATRLAQLCDPDKLRPWLYSIARNEALRRINQRRRETPSDDLPDAPSGDAGPDTLAARTELADLIAEAAGGLSDRDRSVLELAFRHGLGGPDLAEALGVTAANANTIVHRLRETIERSLGALLVSRRVRNTGGCPELASILDGWDGHFNVLMRKRISRHIESCATCDEERRRLVSPVALLGAAPVFIPAAPWLRERTLNEVELTSAASRLAGETDDTAHGGDAKVGRNTRNSVLPVTAFVAALLATLGLIFVFLNMQKTTIPSPIEVSETAPPPVAPSPAPPPPLPTVSVKPVVPATTAPPRRTPTIEQPSSEPTPVAPPPVSEPSPLPPPPPPPPPPPWSPLPEWPQWPQWPGGDPGGPSGPGSQFTGPGDLTGPTPPQPCSTIQCPQP